MDKAIEILTTMLNDLRSAAQAKYMGEEYYGQIDAKIDAIEEAIGLLEYERRQAYQGKRARNHDSIW